MDRHFLLPLGYVIGSVRAENYCRRFLCRVLGRHLSQSSKGGTGEKGATDLKNAQPVAQMKPNEQSGSDDREVSSFWKWKLEMDDWLSKTLEPALLQINKWASWKSGDVQLVPPRTRSISEILVDLQRNKVHVKEWSLGEVTIGLYLIYLSQASTTIMEDFKGVQIYSDSIVQELIYYLELAKGCYKDSASGLALQSMLLESNVLKFVKQSNVMRPGYYIGVDTRNKLVILGIRGTHNIFDIVTDLVAMSESKVPPEGFSAHFGTVQAARWFLLHEIKPIRNILKKYQGFRLRLVGHSLGGAAAAVLAIMLRKMSKEELGFSPDDVRAIGFGTPPCVSQEVAESCASYVCTIALQDDVVPRLSGASLARLRNEIVETDWMSVLEKEEWKRLAEIVSNAKLVASSIQDVAGKLADYAKFMKLSDTHDLPEISGPPENPAEAAPIGSETFVPEELFIPGRVYYIKRGESHSLWRRHAGEHFTRILLSGNFISDHKCESHYYALRDVLKSLPIQDHTSSLHSIFDDP